MLEQRRPTAAGPAAPTRACCSRPCRPTACARCAIDLGGERLRLSRAAPPAPTPGPAGWRSSRCRPISIPPWCALFDKQAQGAGCSDGGGAGQRRRCRSTARTAQAHPGRASPAPSASPTSCRATARCGWRGRWRWPRRQAAPDDQTGRRARAPERRGLAVAVTFYQRRRPTPARSTACRRATRATPRRPQARAYQLATRRHVRSTGRATATTPQAHCCRASTPATSSP